MEPKTLKQFLKLIVLTLIISYSLDKVVFFSLNKISDKVLSGQKIGKINHFLTIKDTTNFIIFGNSRANHHIDGALFGNSTFNIGIDGTRIAFTSALINTLPEDKNQVLLVQIDPRDFFDKDYKGSDIRLLKTKYNRNDKITLALAKSGQLSFLQNIFYSINYNGIAIKIMKNLIRPRYDFKTYDGFDPAYINKSQERKRDIIFSRQSAVECSDNYSFNLIGLHYFEEIISFAKKTNKVLLFITTPLWNDVCTNDNKLLNELMENKNLTYWDFTTLYRDSQNKDFWYDKFHLSYKGAEAFSKLLYSKYKTQKY